MCRIACIDRIGWHIICHDRTGTDYARDLCARSIRNGARFFDAVSRYEDLSTYTQDRRFMDFNDTLKKWSAEEMNDAVRPFRHGGIYLPGIWACLTRPKNIHMYFGCLFAFRYGW